MPAQQQALNVVCRSETFSNYKTLTLKVAIKSIFILGVFFGTIVTIFSCNDRPKEISNIQKNYSRNQEYLFNLLDNYKSEYFATEQQELKDTIQSIYLEKLRHFLVDSLGRHIDSINVTVDSVIQDGWLVTTQFHTREIEFKYGMKFKDNMDPKNDSLYHWMLNLKPKSNLTVNFIHLGSGQLNFPSDTTVPTIKIFAFPEPLTARPK